MKLYMYFGAQPVKVGMPHYQGIEHQLKIKNTYVQPRQESNNFISSRRGSGPGMNRDLM